MPEKPIAWMLTAVAMTGAGCVERPAAPDAGATREAAVYTTFYPTTYFAERIAGGAVPVVCPLPADADPILWRPSAEVIGAYQDAAMIIVNGASLEKWVETTSLPDSRVVVATATIPEGEIILYDEDVTHSHGPAGDHTHEGIDGHVWMDPGNARRQARVIASGLTRFFPDHVNTFVEGSKALDGDLAKLDTRLTALSARLGAVRLLASHPAYNYLDKRFGWGVANLDLDPSAPIAAEAWSEIDALVADGAARPTIMLWESAPRPEVSEALRARHGIVSVTFSPAETLSAEDRAAGVDYISIMNGNVDRLEATAVALTGG